MTWTLVESHQLTVETPVTKLKQLKLGVMSSISGFSTLSGKAQTKVPSEYDQNYCCLCGPVVNPLTLQGRIQDFIEGGFKSIKRGFVSTFCLIFHKFPHEIEIIWSQRGVQANPPNPL